MIHVPIEKKENKKQVQKAPKKTKKTETSQFDSSFFENMKTKYDSIDANDSDSVLDFEN